MYHTVESYTFLEEKGWTLVVLLIIIIINSKEILRNYDKGINKQPLKTEEERLGLDCMPYTEPLG